MNEILHAAADLVNADPFLLFFGSFYIIVGASIFLAKEKWQEFVTLFIKHDSLSLILGIMTLPMSLFVVFFYDNWDTLASTVLMVLGYIGVLKALLLLLRPTIIQGFLDKKFLEKYLWLDGLSGIILGSAMLLL